MSRYLPGKGMAVVAVLLSASAAAPVASSERLPKAFHGRWTAELKNCTDNGELRPITVDARGVTEYEGGYSVRRWTRRGNVWIGRGKQEDDQGSTPATIRLRLRADGTLNFINDGRGPFPDVPGLLRCPASTAPRR